MQGTRDKRHQAIGITVEQRHWRRRGQRAASVLGTAWRARAFHDSSSLRARRSAGRGRIASLPIKLKRHYGITTSAGFDPAGSSELRAAGRSEGRGLTPMLVRRLR